MKTVIRNVAAGAAIVVAMAVLPATAPAFMGEDGPMPAGSHVKRMAKELKLTPEQRLQIKEIFTKEKPKTEPLMKQMVTERRALRSLMQADVIDETEIRAQSAKIAAIQADLAVQRAHLAQEIRGVLTPEQIAKSREIQAKRDKQMEDRAGRQGKRFRQGQ